MALRATRRYALCSNRHFSTSLALAFRRRPYQMIGVRRTRFAW
ncbi:MAG: hypothetical protein WKF43_10660 [Acidimicrobiales bacterium]